MSAGTEAQFDEPFRLQSPVVDREDVEQEAELLKLQGITPNRRIIRMRLTQHSGELLFQGDPGTLAQPIASTTVPPVAVVEMLVSWAIQQSDEVATAILGFLDEPSDAHLDKVVTKLKKAGLVTTPAKGSKNRGSLAEALARYLAQGPRSKDDLYAYARTIHHAERPEAAVRQFLRRGLKNGTLVATDNLYHLVEEAK
jgi:hypothetical protein